MAIELSDPSTISYIRLFPWVRLFRAIRAALDSKKLLLATLGLVALALGWGVLDRLFPSSSAITPEVFREVEFPGPGSALIRVAEPAWLLASPFLAVFAVRGGALGFLHALLAAAWAAAVWGVIGGAIARIALMQVALDEGVGVGSALRFAVRKWAPLVGAPLSPLLAVFLLAALCGLLGLVYRVSGIGPVLAGLVAFLPLLAGLVMAIILLGLAVGWPLMHATIAAEGEDGFDALSRAYSYVNGRPGRYAAYLLLATALGTIGVAFVDLFESVVVHLARWGLSFGAPADTLDAIFRPGAVDGSVAAAVHSFWLGLVRLIAHAWAYSYFWTASAIIYLLLRHDVDGTPWNDIDQPEHEDEACVPEPTTTDAEGSAALVDPLSSAPTEAPALEAAEPDGAAPAGASLPTA